MFFVFQIFIAFHIASDKRLQQKNIFLLSVKHDCPKPKIIPQVAFFKSL